MVQVFSWGQFGTTKNAIVVETFFLIMIVIILYIIAKIMIVIMIMIIIIGIIIIPIGDEHFFSRVIYTVLLDLASFTVIQK